MSRVTAVNDRWRGVFCAVRSILVTSILACTTMRRYSVLRAHLPRRVPPRYTTPGFQSRVGATSIYRTPSGRSVAASSISSI